MTCQALGCLTLLLHTSSLQPAQVPVTEQELLHALTSGEPLVGGSQPASASKADARSLTLMARAHGSVTARAHVSLDQVQADLQTAQMQLQR